MSSQTSGVIGRDLVGIDSQEEISNLDVFTRESTPSEWTDEKHSSYLNSMEASFVQQLYNSIESGGLHSYQNQTDSNSTAQYKVHRNGCWQRMQVGRGGSSRPQQFNERQFLLRNPWIQHYRAKGGRETKVVQENASFESQQPMGGRGRTMYTCGFVNVREHSSDAQTYQDSSVGREYSDQNFDDKDNEGGSGKVG